MNNTDDLKALWAMQPAADRPDSKTLVQKAVRSKNKLLFRFLLSSVALVLTTVFLLFIWVFFQPQLFTTKLGIILIIGAIGLYLTASQSSVELLYKKTNILDLSSFLKRIKQVKEKQKHLQGSVLLAYFILLSAGLFLYMIEYAQRMTRVGQIAAFGLTTAWILFNWFYIRPRTIKKQQAHINGIIQRLEEVMGQLEEVRN